ncbi:MAG: biopolymer transporter ExbD [Candidatus Omnitrophica bacterium]|nr:biopolymer transporter ExbD [Candidatus Omnitrophota bacterium]
MELIRAKKPKLSIDLAPLIDVVFQLLVFFMLTATFTNPSMKMLLPGAQANEPRTPQNIVISINKEGAIAINTQKTTLANFQTDLKQILDQSEKKSVHVRGDKDMPYKYFVQVMDLAKQAGALQINIVHQKKE